MCVDIQSFYEVYSEWYIKIHYRSKIFYLYEAAQICTSVLNDRKGGDLLTLYLGPVIFVKIVVTCIMSSS